MKFCDRESREGNKKTQRERRKCGSKNEHAAEEWKKSQWGGEDGETMTNPDECVSQHGPNTYYITQPDLSDKSLNMQIARYLFQWQITSHINRLVKYNAHRRLRAHTLSTDHNTHMQVVYCIGCAFQTQWSINWINAAFVLMINTIMSHVCSA